MVAAIHPGKIRHRHMALDAVYIALFMVCMGLEVISFVQMAGYTSVIGFVLKSKSAAGSMAIDTIQLAGLGTGTHPPCGECIVFAQIAAVRIEIPVFERDQIGVLKEVVARNKLVGNRHSFCVAG